MESFDNGHKAYKGLFAFCDLSWNQHIASITETARKSIRISKKILEDFKDVDIMKTLYNGLVRPLLEYACEL